MEPGPKKSEKEGKRSTSVAGPNMNETPEFKIPFPINYGSEEKKLTSVAGRNMNETPEFKIPIKSGSENKKLTSVAGRNMNETPEFKISIPIKSRSEDKKLTSAAEPPMNITPEFKIPFPIKYGSEEKKSTSFVGLNMNETPEFKIPMKSGSEDKKLTSVAGRNMNETPEFKIPFPIKYGSEEKKLTSVAGRNMNETPEFKIPIPIKSGSEEKKSTLFAGLNKNATPEFKIPIPIKSWSADIKLPSVAEPPMNLIPKLKIPFPIKSESSGAVRAINITPEDITPEHNQGVTKLLLLEGQGDKPGYGDKVAIRYDSNLLNEGKVIARERQVHSSFVIGKEENILIGMDLAVTTMTKGEISTFIIGHPPYYLAKAKRPLAPLKTQLVYNIAMLDWEPGDSSQKNESGIVRQMPALNEMATFTYGDSNVLTMEWLGCQLDDKRANVSDITPEKNRGVIKELLKEGQGVMPQYGDIAMIRYDHNLIVNGVLIPQSKEVEVSFNIGKDENILRGMDLAVTTMKKGEISTFIIRDAPYNLAKTKESEAPQNTRIVFTIEMLDCQLEDLSPKKDLSILRKVIVKGEGALVPNEGSKVTVHLVGKVNGKVFENGIKEFLLGEGSCHGIPHGLEIALYKFRRSEKSVIYLNAKHGILKGISEIGIPPQTPVSYEVIMLAFKRAKELWEMNTDEKYTKAKFSRERGIEFVSSKNYKIALMHFRWIIRCLQDEPGVDVKTVHLRNDLLQSGYMNMALCLLKLGKTKETIQFCNKALQLDPDNEKALCRRGMANIQNKDFEEALRDFKRLIYLYPKNQYAKKCILHCQDGIKKQQLQAKNSFNRMFDKFVQQDEARAKKIKTETGVWDDENEATEGKEAEKQHLLNETERLLQENDSVLQDANVIELSSNLGGKF